MGSQGLVSHGAFDSDMRGLVDIGDGAESEPKDLAAARCVANPSDARLTILLDIECYRARAGA